MAASQSRLIIDEPQAGRFRVNRIAYVSEEIAQLEQEHIFDRVWLYLGHESEVPAPHDFVSRTIVGRPLLMWRDAAGELRVFFNTCTHRGTELCRISSGNQKQFQCFYHAWTFNSNGELTGVPDKGGAPSSFEMSEFNLVPPAQVENYRGFVFISFNLHVPSLVDYLGSAREYLDLVAEHSETGMEIVQGSQEYAILANWKLLVENSLDGYHLAPLHRTYFAYLRRSGNAVDAKRRTHAYDLGAGHAVIVDRAPWARPTARWQPSLGEDTRQEVEQRYERLIARLGPERADRVAQTDRNLLIYPNLIINDIMAVTVRAIWPAGAGRMRVTAWALAPKDDTPTLRAATLRNFTSFLGPGGFATPDDIEALESVQRALGSAREVPWSDMSRGVDRAEGHASSDEEQARAFWRQWHRHIGVEFGASPAAARVREPAQTS